MAPYTIVIFIVLGIFALIIIGTVVSQSQYGSRSSKTEESSGGYVPQYRIADSDEQFDWSTGDSGDYEAVAL